jgi:hypothetical protein
MTSVGSSKKVKKLDPKIPLEIQDEKEFKELDDEQKEFIEEKLIDLVLVENAAELFRREVEESGEKIDYILSTVNNGRALILTREVFTLDLNEKIPEKEIKDFIKKSNLKELLKTKKNIIGIIGLELIEEGKDDVGGHHIAFLRKPSGEIMVYDSMYPYSPYGHIVEKQVLNVIFDTKNETGIYDENGNASFKLTKPSILSFQETGGFSDHHIPPRRFNMKKSKYISIRCSEAQNHFCYMWCILFLHMAVVTGNIMEPYDQLQLLDKDPLAIIKVYMWNICKKLNISIKYREFFDANFPYFIDIREKERNNDFIKFVPVKYFIKNIECDCKYIDDVLAYTLSDNYKIKKVDFETKVKRKVFRNRE